MILYLVSHFNVESGLQSGTNPTRQRGMPSLTRRVCKGAVARAVYLLRLRKRLRIHLAQNRELGDLLRHERLAIALGFRLGGALDAVEIFVVVVSRVLQELHAPETDDLGYLPHRKAARLVEIEFK